MKKSVSESPKKIKSLDSQEFTVYTSTDGESGLCTLIDCAI